MTDQPAALPFYDRDTIRSALAPTDAVAAVHAALAAGLDPAAGQPRTAMQLTHGEFLMMPAEFGAHAGVKVLTVAPHNPERNLPRVQGVYVLFDAETGTPTALLDGSELTAVRTPAVSLAAVRDRLLADQNPMRVVVFGAGTQARSHLRTLFAVIEGRRSLADLVVAVRRPQDETAARLADGPTCAAPSSGSGPAPPTGQSPTPISSCARRVEPSRYSTAPWSATARPSSASARTNRMRVKSTTS